jgi:hypothetical protein
MDVVNYALGLESVDGAARAGASGVYRRWVDPYTENEGPHVSWTHGSRYSERTGNPSVVALSGPTSARGEKRTSRSMRYLAGCEAHVAAGERIGEVN